MDNLQIWIYIIVGILYLIGRASKKTQNQTSKQSQERPGTSHLPKQLTFEELLKEITEARQPQQAPKPVQEVVDYDDEIEDEEEAEVLERTDYDYRKEETYKAYEKSKYEAFNRLSYEDTLKLEDTKVEFGKFKAFEEKAPPSMAAQVASDFTDMDKVKRAFIMSEIFNRKYA
jgi:hypothetical protein